MELQITLLDKEQVHGNILNGIAKLKRNEIGLASILRWEDDGGRGFETNNVLPQVTENKTHRMMDTFKGHLV